MALGIKIDNEQKALNLLRGKFYSEFEVDGVENKHPNSKDFEEWLFKNEVITDSQYKAIKYDSEGIVSDSEGIS